MSPSPSIHQDADEQLRAACDELRDRLIAGEACRAEDYFILYPALAADPGHAVGLILAEYLALRGMGRESDPVEWLDRFPRWREPLRRCFAELEGEAPAFPSTADLTTANLGHRAADTDPVLAPPLGQHELFGEVGHGGMGVVYKARDMVLNRLVALKVIRSGVLARPDEVERFYREARAAARLRHPHIVPIFGMGIHEGLHCYTMPFVGGGSLADHLPDFGGHPRRAVALVEKVARAVQAAHEAGVIHRDLKPGNILLDDNGEPLVGDFGLAKCSDTPGDMTVAGDIIGTPAYMPPEQAAGGAWRVTPACDVWALGIILYELLTGRRPFIGDSSDEIKRQLLTDDPTPPRRLCHDLPRDLEVIVLKCLEKRPARRYASAADLADDLAAWLRGEPIRARPEGWMRWAWRKGRRHLVQGAAALALVAAIVVPMLLRRSPRPPVDEVAAINDRLAAGQAVTLMGSDGLPPWRRVRSGNGGLAARADEPDAFLLNAWKHDVVELLADPRWESYRFSAQVRHEVSNVGDSGLFMLYSEQATARGVEKFFATLTFADRGLQAGHVGLNMRHFRDDLTHKSRCGAQRFAPAPGTWRELAIEVSPARIKAWMDGRLVGELTPDNLKRSAGQLLRIDPTPGLAPPTFPRRGPLGIFTFESSASFRHIVVEPHP